MVDRRGSITLFVVIGVVVLIAVLLFIFVINSNKEGPKASTTWEQPVSEYLRLCLQRSTDDAATRILKGAGYMINESTLVPGFGSATLLYANALIPVYYDRATDKYALVAVFDTDPGKVKRVPNAPCFADTGEVGSEFGCDKKAFFRNNANFPFGGGAVSEYQFRELPELALYKQDPGFPYAPSCEEYPCGFSVQGQAETHIGDAMRTCIASAQTEFKNRGITIAYADQSGAAEPVTISIRDEGLGARIAPLTLSFEGEKKLLDTVQYVSPKKVKQLFTLAHGGSTDAVLGATGIIEAESRDPDFIVDRDGNDILENVLSLNPGTYHITSAASPEESTIVTLSFDGDEQGKSALPFVMINRKPFLNQVAPAEVMLFGRGTGFVVNTTPLRDLTPATVPETYIEFEYQLYLDAKDSDDFSLSGNDLFRLRNDQVSIEGVELLDDKGGAIELAQIGSTYIYYPDEHKLVFRLRFKEGYALAETLLFNSSGGPHPITAPYGQLIAYIDSFEESVPLRLSIRDAKGNIDFIILTATAHYQYGANLPEQQVIYVNDEPITFDQAWPWLILPNIDEGLVEHHIYFYERNDSLQKCRINFANRRPFNPELIGTLFLPDNNLTHFGEYAPEIYKAMIAIKLEQGKSFGFDQCCPSYDLMDKFRARGICAPELCCLSAPFLGHEIRFFEKGAYNTTTNYGGTRDACNLKKDYSQIGGDFYPEYLNLFYAQNSVMDYRENLDIVQSGQSPDQGTPTPSAVFQVLPLRFKPDLYDVRTGESYQGPMEDYFQTFADVAHESAWTISWHEGTRIDRTIDGAGDKLKALFGEQENMFEEGWTWWDYRSVLRECDDGWTRRDMQVGDCVPSLLDQAMAQADEYNLTLLDPYICDPSDFASNNTQLATIADFAAAQGRCPNLLETMRNIMNGSADCNITGCCFEPPIGRSFFIFSVDDPRIFEQYGSWVPEYSISGTALIVNPVGERPSYCEGCVQKELCSPGENCPATLVSFLNTTNPYLSGGPFRTMLPSTRITNFQWISRVVQGEGETQKRAGDTLNPGEGQIEYGSDDQAECTTKKILHRCSFGEGYGYDATSFIGAGIDPTKIGLHPNGTRSCPDPQLAYLLMVNGTCRIEDCCFEIAPEPWQTSQGAPGGGNLGDYSAPCPLIPAVDEDDDGDVEYEPPTPPPSGPPTGEAGGTLS